MKDLKICYLAAPTIRGIIATLKGSQLLRNLQREMTFLHKIFDLTIILSSWMISYFIRFSSYHPEHAWYLKFTLLLVVLQYYYFRRFGLYTSQRLKNIGSELLATLKANTSVIISFVLGVYFFSPDKISRAVLINYALISTIFLLIAKFAMRSFLRRQRAKGLNLRYVLLVGDGAQIEDYVKVVRSNPEIGLRIRGWAHSNGLSKKYGIESIDQVDAQNLKKIFCDYVVIGFAFKNYSMVDPVLKKISQELVEITILPDVSYALIGHQITDFSGIPVITINQPHFSSKSIILKRAFDLVVAFLSLVILFPSFVIIAIAVKCSSQGPIFFGQRRIGLDGSEFTMWKFRSMRIDAESDGAGWTTAEDPRKTKIGSFLRKTSLDELPQLWNVLVGEMSLVGPRPEQPYFVEKFKEEIPAYMLRHKMKAGITGWAQVNGWRGDTSIASRIECDIWYIKNWSIWLDLGIIVMTFWKGIINKNAY